LVARLVALPGYLYDLGEMRVAALLIVTLSLPALAPGATGPWSSRAPMPLPRSEVVGARIGSEIFVVGGLTADGRNWPRADAYSTTKDTWRRIPDLPVSLDHTMAAGYRGKLYVAGGYGSDRSIVDRLFVYSRGSWTSLGRMPESRAAGGSVIVGGKLYIVGGVTSAGGGRALSELVLVYDIARRRWSELLGPTPREHLAVTSLGGRIYVIGGRKAGADTNLALVEVLTPGRRKWQRLPRLPSSRGGTGAAGIAGSIVSVGGETSTRTIGTVYRYDVKRRRWSRLPNLPTPRHGLGVVAVGGRVYVIGGGTSPGLSVSSANESLPLRTAAR
jgi:N-acetylneuraminic acid mutarotase